MAKLSNIAARFALLALVSLGLPFTTASQQQAGAGRRPDQLDSGGWRKYSTGELELYSNSSPERAKWVASLCAQRLRDFESVGLFSPGIADERVLAKPRLQVLHFRDLATFLPFRIAANAPAFHIGGRGRSLVLLEDLGDELGEVTTHEFFHVYSERSGTTLPVWLAEGLADYFSTMQYERGADGSPPILRIGDPVARHQRALNLRAASPASTASLFAVTHNTRHRGRAEPALSFYAESWLIAHMMQSVSPWRQRFPEFVAVVALKGSVDALAQVYSATPAQLDQAAAEYLAAGQFPVRRVPLQQGLPEDPLVRDAPMPPWELALLQADILAYRGQRGAALTAYEELRNQYPLVPEVHESLGNLAVDDMDMDSARKHFASAADAGSRNGEIYYQLATLSCGMQSEDIRCMDWLRRALDFAAPNREFRQYAVDYALNTGNYAQALTWMEYLQPTDASRRVDLHTKQAYALYHLEDFDGARIALTKASGAATTPGHRKAIRDLNRAVAEREEFSLQMELFRDANGADETPRRTALARLLESFAASPNAVIETVRLLEVRCDPAGLALLVDTASGRRKLAIQNAMDLMVLEGTQRVRELELTCGPADGKRIRVGYLLAGTEEDLDGTLRILQFGKADTQP